MTKHGEKLAAKMRQRNRVYLERVERARSAGPEHAEAMRRYWKKRRELEAAGDFSPPVRRQLHRMAMRYLRAFGAENASPEHFLEWCRGRVL